MPFEALFGGGDAGVAEVESGWGCGTAVAIRRSYRKSALNRIFGTFVVGRIVERVGAVCRCREWIPGCCSTSNNVERSACPARVLTGLHLIHGGARLVATRHLKKGRGGDLLLFIPVGESIGLAGLLGDGLHVPRMHRPERVVPV